MALVIKCETYLLTYFILDPRIYQELEHVKAYFYTIQWEDCMIQSAMASHAFVEIRGVQYGTVSPCLCSCLLWTSPQPKKGTLSSAQSSQASTYLASHAQLA